MRDRFGVGGARLNLAVLHVQMARVKTRTAEERAILLHRAKAYAKAALGDFQHYEGRSAEQERKARGLITRIDELLAESS